MKLQKPWPYRGTASGVILYEGPSHIDGRPIVAIATLKSTNPKTGNMAQVWILRADVSPVFAIRTGKDASICGNCPHRGRNGKGRSCYVQVPQAPTSVWKGYRRGIYPHATPQALAGRFVRLGAYGDPSALPLSLLRDIVSAAAGHTAYTHQWREGFALQDVAMASTECDTDDRLARSMGYRVFRVTRGAGGKRGLVLCPASEQAGHRVQCSDCRQCGGSDGRKGAGIYIPLHGASAVVSNGRKLQVLQ